MTGFYPRPADVQIFSDQAGYATLEVAVIRHWVDTAPGVRTPMDGRVEFRLTAGDYCAGHEVLTLAEARQLREMLDTALLLAEERITLNEGLTDG